MLQKTKEAQEGSTLGDGMIEKANGQRDYRVIQTPVPEKRQIVAFMIIPRYTFQVQQSR